MSKTVPPILPPLGTNTENPSASSPNRVDTISTDTINTTTTTNNDLILAHEGPSDTKDTKIAASRLKFNAFKALEGEKMNGTFTRLKCLLNDLKNKGVTIPQAEVNATFVNSLPRKCDSDVEEDSRSSSEFLADLNAEFHERALLENQKRLYKRSGRDEVTTKVKAFMAIAEEEPSVGKADARSGQWVEITMKKALGGRGKRKEKISSKEVIFTKADESSSVPTPDITSDSESECDTQEPLPSLPKLIGAEPTGTSNSLISLADLTLNMADLTLNITVPKKTKQSSDKKADSFTEKQLLLTLMDEEYLKRSVWYLDSGCSRHMTGVKQYLHRYSKESGPKVVFGDNSSGDTEGYGSVNYNEITFTRVAYVNGLRHNLINISQLCDANFEVVFIKTQKTILNQNNEVVLIAPRRRDVYVIDMS
ncbi:hypothetical protein Tco_1353466 [Tanacetum coccineum]